MTAKVGGLSVHAKNRFENWMELTFLHYGAINVRLDQQSVRYFVCCRSASLSQTTFHTTQTENYVPNHRRK